MPLDLSKIGPLLQASRLEKNLSFRNVSDALFIRKRIIEAIETGTWENLPHEVYVKGYVTQYSSFLGIRDVIETELARMGDSPVGLAQPTPRPETGLTGAARPETRRRRIAGAAMVAFVAGGFFVFQNLRTPVYVAPSPSQSTEVSYQQVSASATLPQGQSDKVYLEAKKLMIACQQRTWVRIVIDGSEKKEFMMNPEEVIVLSGKEGFDLLIGNAGGVKLFYNGKDTGFAGEEGEVKRINLS
jgi:cytoskeleton protein RodZ